MLSSQALDPAGDSRSRKVEVNGDLRLSHLTFICVNLAPFYLLLRIRGSMIATIANSEEPRSEGERCSGYSGL